MGYDIKMNIDENKLSYFCMITLDKERNADISFLFHWTTSDILVKITLSFNSLLTPDSTGEVLTVNAIKLFNKQQRTQKQRLISLKNITLKLVTMCPNLLVCRVT